jgi:hypothetical protein
LQDNKKKKKGKAFYDKLNKKINIEKSIKILFSESLILLKKIYKKKIKLALQKKNGQVLLIPYGIFVKQLKVLNKPCIV